MARRGSISDYPEHLNPFYEGDKGTFWRLSRFRKSSSFGETLRNTLTLKSIRGKKKKSKREPSYSPPQLRRPIPMTNATLYRQTVPAALPQQTPEPLPRSRFSERVAKSPATPNGRVPSPANPFEEDGTVPELKPRRMRRKRKAPLPPGMAREEGDAYLNVSSAHNLSKWSLTSFETDVSTYSENEPPVQEGANEAVAEMVNHITKEMEKLTEETKERSDVPDLIVSTERKTDDVPTANGIDEESVAETEVIEESAEKNGTEEVKKEDTTIDENSNLVEKCEADSIACDDQPEEVNIIQSEEEKVHSSQLEEEDATPENATTPEDATTSEDATVSENVSFNENKSEYIMGSSEDLENDTKTETVDINQNESDVPASPTCKTEMTIIVNSEETIQEEETTKPVAKIRTNVPTKHELLGNDVIEAT